jgi:hypothetical protein
MMPIKCDYKQVNGKCNHPGDRSCDDACVPTDETIANSMPKLAEHGKDRVTIKEITKFVDDNPEFDISDFEVVPDPYLEGIIAKGVVVTDNRPATKTKHYHPHAVTMGDSTKQRFFAPVDDLSNFGKNKAGEPERADNITTFCCYQCLHTVKWLNADSRCKDCTRLTPEETRGG